jgi:hypothetical protein
LFILYGSSAVPASRSMSSCNASDFEWFTGMNAVLNVGGGDPLDWTACMGDPTCMG